MFAPTAAPIKNRRLGVGRSRANSHGSAMCHLSGTDLTRQTLVIFSKRKCAPPCCRESWFTPTSQPERPQFRELRIVNLRFYLRSPHSSGVRSAEFSSRTAVLEQTSGLFLGARSHQLFDTLAQSPRVESRRRVSSRDALRCAPQSSRLLLSKLSLQTNTWHSASVQLRRRSIDRDPAPVRLKDSRNSCRRKWRCHDAFCQWPLRSRY
jgi:hypothetical protein